MPKIIFRPNPTPPPFVPPTPSYDTHYYAQAETQNFDPENPLFLKFSPCTYPEFDYANIYIGSVIVGFYNENSLITDDFWPVDTEISGTVPFQGRIEFLKHVPQQSDLVVHSAPLDVSFGG